MKARVQVAAKAAFRSAPKLSSAWTPPARRCALPKHLRPVGIEIDQTEVVTKQRSNVIRDILCHGKYHLFVVSCLTISDAPRAEMFAQYTTGLPPDGEWIGDLL